MSFRIEFEGRIVARGENKRGQWARVEQLVSKPDGGHFTMTHMVGAADGEHVPDESSYVTVKAEGYPKLDEYGGKQTAKMVIFDASFEPATDQQSATDEEIPF
jgi:hypothetical protein